MIETVLSVIVAVVVWGIVLSVAVVGLQIAFVGVFFAVRRLLGYRD